jgi:ABC-type glycerol-3-phosphate transport system permease component
VRQERTNEQTERYQGGHDATLRHLPALVAAAPPLIVYAFLMDYHIAGLTAGGTKG